MESDVTIEKNLPLTLKDGVTLCSDIYYLSSLETGPVLLMRQPYGRDIASTVVYAQPEFFARAGFVVVIQDVRGRGSSEGEFYTFVNEREDGIETIDWAASLPKSDGRVCMYGFSYQAYTQLAVLQRIPPALKAIAPHMTAADLYRGWFYKAGILRLATTVSWANQMLREDAWRTGSTDTALALEKSYAANGSLLGYLPLNQVDPLTREDIPSYAADWLAHPNADEFWAGLDCSDDLAKANIPVFHLAGYYDFYSEGSMRAYACRHDKRRDDFLLLSPWKHIPWERWMDGEDLGSEARLDTDQLLVDWFKAQLGDARGSLRGVRYFVLGENRWRTAAVWPPETNEMKTLYLASGGRANSLFGDGRLVHDSAYGPSDTFVYDPQVPVTAPGGNPVKWGPVDLKAQQQGNNLLVFTAEPQGAAELTIAGHPELHLWVQSTAEDTDFVARLSWLRKDGRASFLTLAAAPLSSGEQHSDGRTQLHLKFDATAVTLAAGESIRLDIASSAFPLLARNPNNGGSALSVKNHAEFKTARQTILHDQASPSALHLPIVCCA